MGNRKRPVPPPIVKDQSREAKYEQIIWHAPHTQTKRNEATTKSAELNHRRKFQPSFNEKIVEHSKYMNQKLKHERMTQMLAEAKMQYESDLKANTSGSDVNSVTGLADIVVDVAKRRSSIQAQLDMDEEELADFDDEAFQL